MKRRVRIGMLTPSSNTVLEPVTMAMLSGLPEVSVHFARFPVTEIALSSAALGQFDEAPILHAAQMLAHAKVDVIAWNGTSSGWLGFDADQRLCDSIRRVTGIMACTSVSALDAIFDVTGVRRFGLVSPYRDDVQEAIVRNFAAEGYTCAAERHLGIQDNFSFGEVGAATLQGMVRDVAAAQPDAITIFCTNLAGAPLAQALEEETGIAVYDTVATAVWGALRVAGVDTRRVRGWGKLFREPF
jgi:maleate isomerase